MPLRSMTGYAQVKAAANGELSFSLSLKSVNHRFLDLQLRLPADSDGLEMKLRRLLKEKLSRGHVELTLNIERDGAGELHFDRKLISAYVKAFRAAASSLGWMDGSFRASSRTIGSTHRLIARGSRGAEYRSGWPSTFI